LVVFEPGTALDLDDTGDVEAGGECAVAGGESGAVESGVVFGGPGDAFGARGVEEVDVGVDHARRGGLGRGGDSGGSEKGSAIQHVKTEYRR
jgi:hypothetical protein